MLDWIGRSQLGSKSGTKGCACLVHGASWRHGLHDISPAAVCTHWEPAANDLAERRDVWCDAKVRLSTALGDPEASHDLIEAEQGTLLRGNLSESLQPRRCPPSSTVAPPLGNRGRHPRVPALTCMLHDSLHHRQMPDDSHAARL